MKKKKLDSVWQKQFGGPDDDQNPEVPLLAGDQVVLVANAGARGVDARSGASRWTFSLYADDSWQVASDGTHVYQIARDEHRDANGSLRTVSFFLARVDLATGKAGKRLAPVSDAQHNGIINRLLAVADDTAYLAISHGKVKRYERQLPWSVMAVNLATGSRKWTDPLPFRSAESDENHFLSAKVVGGLLVALQQMNDGKVRVVARDIRTGKVAWDKPWKGADRRLVRDPLTADDKHLYLGYGPLRALRLSDGGQAWDTAATRPGKTYGPCGPQGRGAVRGGEGPRPGRVRHREREAAVGGEERGGPTGGPRRPSGGRLRVRLHVQPDRPGPPGRRPHLAHHRAALQDQRDPLHRP